MPKAKPSQVIVHRIELQEKERDMLEAVVAGQTVKNVVVPVAITAGVGSAAYIGYKSAKAAFGWTEDLVTDIKGKMNDVQQAFEDTPFVMTPDPSREQPKTIPIGLRGLYGIKTFLFGE